MRPLVSETSLNKLRAVYADALFDECVRMVFSQPDSDFGHAHPTYTPGDTLRCMFRPATRSNELLGIAQVENVDAICYLPRTATITSKDRLKVTKLHGETITNKTYEILAGPIVDQVLQKVALRLVTDGSES